MQRGLRSFVRLLRVSLVWAIVLALVVAPTLMHGRASGGAGHQHFTPAAPHTHVAMAHGHGQHAMVEQDAPSDGTSDIQAPADNQAAGACFNCVICIGAITVAPCATAPEHHRIALLPAPTQALATLDPEPGVRPPLA